MKALVYSAAIASSLLLAATNPVQAQQTPGHDQAKTHLARARMQLTPNYPPSRAQQATTAGETYLNNLDASIASLRQAGTDSAPRATALARKLYHRWRIVGAAEDLTAAREQLNAALQADGEYLQARLLQASIAMGEHRFDAARRALKQASADAADNGLLARKLREIDVATGRVKLTAADLESTPASWSAAAVMAREWADRGRPDLATAVLHDSILSYGDTNPYPVAWLMMQQGIVFLRYEQMAAAKRFFAAAVERLPNYTLALEHLGEVELALGNLDAAEAAYRRALANDRAPLFLWQQAKVKAAQGAEAEAQTFREQALEAMKIAAQATPLLVAGHGVGVLLEADRTAAAVELARLNRQHRDTWRAALLLAQAELAAAHVDRACMAFNEAQAEAPQAPEIRGFAETLGERCAGVDIPT